MNLSTHRGADTGEHPRRSFWSIALIIIISALLAVIVEPLFPNPVLAAHGGAARVVHTTADNQQ